MKLLKALYGKSQILFAIFWIVTYCLVLSIGDALSQKIGIEKAITLVMALILSAILFWFLKKNRLFSAYGLCAPKTSFRSMLYYLPIVIMLSANFWCGVTKSTDALAITLHILTMLCVGFLEEVIFRGLLFEAMRKDSLKAAVIVSAVTFGVGHTVNLINGSGALLVSNLLQVVYATAAGFMFVMMYVKSKSLLIPITAHGIFNALSIFANEDGKTLAITLLSSILLTLVCAFYALYLALSMRKKQ